MIRFTQQDEPPEWQTRCRKRGRKWLKSNKGYDRPHDYWTEFEIDLRRAFQNLCAYSAMIVMKADMDHFIPVAVLKKRRKDNLAYEWSNFRYGEGVINQRKHDHLVLDPFDVRDNWFELLLPSLQLVLTDRVPKQRRKKAEFTLKQLGLRDSEVVVRYRGTFFELYRKRRLTVEGLHDLAPIIARAVQRDLAAGIDWRYPLVPNGVRKRQTDVMRRR